jgi:hypothetical protein
MFTRRHYEAVEEVLRACLAVAEDARPKDHFRSGHIYGIAETAQTLSAIFTLDSPRFNEEKFLLACGFSEAVVTGIVSRNTELLDKYHRGEI